MARTFQEIIKEDDNVIIDFYATWCGPCKTMAPILEDVKKQLGDKVTILKVDVDKNPQAAQAYNVQGVPTLVVYKKGNLIFQQAGVIPAKSIVEVVNN